MTSNQNTPAATAKIEKIYEDEYCSVLQPTGKFTQPGHHYKLYVHRRPAAGANSQAPIYIDFQKGQKPAAVNGFTTEGFLAMLIHRVESLDRLFPCSQNKKAATSMKLAVQALADRTKDRVARGVEGQFKD